MEQQTAVRRSSVPDPFDDVTTNVDVRLNMIIERERRFVLDIEKESILFSNTFGYLFGSLTTFTTLFLRLLR